MPLLMGFFSFFALLPKFYLGSFLFIWAFLSLFFAFWWLFYSLNTALWHWLQFVA